MHNFAACLTEAGFPSQMSADGGIEIDEGPPEQSVQFTAAREACVDEQGGYPTSSKLSSEEIGRLYDLQVEGRRCLLARGEVIGEPPSREKFIADYEGSLAGLGTIPWSPWLESSEDGLEACPQPDRSDLD